MSDQKIPVGVLGATGSVGQRFVALLADHPWFEIVALTASERSAGRRYAEAARWLQEASLPAELGALEVRPTVAPLPCRILFSALDGDIAGELESALAEAGHFVVSNAKSHRMDSDVPLLVPEVNADHLTLLRRQSFGEGAIVTNPNCSTIGLVMALKPLDDEFGVEAVSVVTLQALSGAGIPGVPSLEILDNVIPYIGGEEEKIERETRKILGLVAEEGVAPAAITISAQCNRVAVVDGHTECVSVRFRRRPEMSELRAALSAFRGEPQHLDLPSAPQCPIEVVEQLDRPQPRLDRGRGSGMTVTVGRVRPCPLLDAKMVVLSHNTLRGAAGGAILVAELAVAKGMVSGVTRPRAAG